MDRTVIERWLEVRGKVQNVVFRQTVTCAMQKRVLEGGATKDSQDKNLIQDWIAVLREGKPVKDWGAKATSVDDASSEQGLTLEVHQVTTANVDKNKWNPNVKSVHIR
ncbi:hypothetical protein PsorP6_012874 [Peronosclerospora sorghi]|uniref:Uncharacterized protein n=1 Tax=Peronosclerospora sorghi TaxID=230839 RepID=A0ACC0WEV2_9STRA|nr:hypothetical protein PsorP6_012874 [Peronosclerospora sorghi]